MNDLNKIWHIDMQLDATEEERKNGIDGTIEFTKSGLIDWLLTDEYTKDFFSDCLSYKTSDEDLKKLLSEYCHDWKVLSIK